MLIRRRLVFALLAIVCLPQAVFAAGDKPASQKHNFRIGWGDMLFETAAYYPGVSHKFDNPAGLPDNYRVRERFNYKFTGHIFAEYSYRLGDVVSLGAMLDYESICWQRGIFDKDHQLTETLPDVNFHNFVFMPTARFTYFQEDIVSMYSGLGAGLLMSVADKLEPAPAFYLNLVGIQLGRGHWHGALDLGMLNAMRGTQNIYMLASRIFSVSLNYCW